MSESHELYASVNYIKHKVDAIEKIELLNLRSNKVLQEEYAILLKSDPLLLSVYKAIDGVKSQSEITKELCSNNASVSRKVRDLEEYGLIEIKEIGRSGRKIHKHSIAEKAFALTKL